MNEKVSIVIPVYNREKLVGRAIESAINQSYNNIEIIVIDNCSKDNTFEVCKKYEKNDSRIKVYKNEENIGPVKNWMRGISKASGYYTKIIFSDDWIDRNYIEECIKFMSNDVAFVFTPALIHEEWKENKNDEISIHYNIGNSSEYIFKDFFIDNSLIFNNKIEIPVSPGTAIFRTHDLMENTITEIPNEENLVFNTYGAGNDLLMFLLTAASKNYNRIGFVNSTLAHFGAHEGSFSVANNLQKYYDYAKVFFVNRYGDIELRDKVKAMLQYSAMNKENYEKLYETCNGKLKLEYLKEEFKKYDEINKLIKKKFVFMEKMLENFVGDEYVSEKIIEMYGKLRISIYGCGILGRAIYKQLKREDMLEINYFVDQKVRGDINVRCLSLDEYVEVYKENELLIVSPFYYFSEIEKEIKSKRKQIKFISIEEVLY
jgi:glycosyltransferase involved in cell wall biosynthesis